jgi:nicotinic acid phosphoribosyltransferase
MAVGDVFSGLSSVAAGDYLDIQPSGTVEAVIHNIYHASDIQLEFYDGTNSLIFDTDTGAGVYAKYAFHVTNGLRIRVKNISASSQLIGYDGIVTHA